MSGNVATLTNTDEMQQRIASKIDPAAGNGMAMTQLQGGATFLPTTAAEAMEFSKMMSISGIMVRKHFRNHPGACLGMVMQAMRWGMDPFAVANKTYLVKNRDGDEQIAFEAQLITAVLNTRAPIKGRIKYEFSGDGDNKRCRAYAHLAEVDEDPVEAWSPPLGQIHPKNSPLWKSDPEQQLCYYTSRLLARRHFPEVLLGVYDPDELQDVGNYRATADGRTEAIPPRPTRADFQEVEEAEESPDPFRMVDRFGEIIADDIDGRRFAGMILQQLDQCGTAVEIETVTEANSDDIQRLDEHQRNNMEEGLRAANARLRSTAKATGAYPTGTAYEDAEEAVQEAETPSQQDGPANDDPMVTIANTVAAKGTKALDGWFKKNAEGLESDWMKRHEKALRVKAAAADGRQDQPSMV